MNQPAKQIDELTLEMVGTDPKQLPLESFAKAVTSLNLLLAALDKGKTVDWKVTEISMNSPMAMTAVAFPVKDRWNPGIVDEANSILRAINEGRAATGFPRQAITHARSLARVLSDGVAKIELRSPSRKPVVLRKLRTDETKKIWHEAQQHDEYKADVELTGILETATTATGVLVFYVRDPLINQRTECDVSDRGLFNQALGAMQKYEKPRVAVYGKTIYVDGRPSRMKVERLEVLSSPQEHPGFFAVQGIDITGGMEVSDYLRSIRGGD